MILIGQLDVDNWGTGKWRYGEEKWRRRRGKYNWKWRQEEETIDLKVGLLIGILLFKLLIWNKNLR